MTTPSDSAQPDPKKITKETKVMLGIILGYATFVVFYMVFMMANAPRAGENLCGNDSHTLIESQKHYQLVPAMHPSQQLDCQELRRPIGMRFENSREGLQVSQAL